ncbi:MAG: 4Fe-4S binding protein [Clostridia bacterium]|nr:4Fe-4S binding protein [Clostridia bacterium]MDH7572752.1 4Fe-4S binding protein [Clostridia bacterium]
MCLRVFLGQVLEFEKLMARLEFRINQDKCRYPKCHHCAENCPVGAIDFTVSPPLFTRRCIECGLCEQTCPQGAIEVDWQSVQDIHDRVSYPEDRPSTNILNLC